MDNTTNDLRALSASDLFAALRPGDLPAALRVLRYAEAVTANVNPLWVPLIANVKNLVDGLNQTAIQTRKECRAVIRAANVSDQRTGRADHR